MTEFEGVVPALGKALSKRGYSELTPVQRAVLAPELEGADILVSAQTGSGKTVAFGLALAPMLLNGADRFARATAPLALAVAPTRELALQVKRELEWLYEMTGASVVSCVGGMDMRTERQALGRGAHIVVGTPGRLRDHIERGSLKMTALEAVVLDEADEMLDMGFREDLEYILGTAPAERRTLLFSATVPRSIIALAKRYQRDAVRISTSAEQEQHVDIEYRALTIAPNDQENAIVNVLRYFEAKNAIVFCATRATVNHMTSRFTNRGLSVVALSGELSQNERSHALQAMRDGRARVCIATDVAARGLDLPNLELVIHADIPKSRESLLHRSGRTGRAGRKGVSVLIVPYSARRRTERLLQSANVEAAWAKPPSVDEIMRRDDERILADPALSEPFGRGEQVFARSFWPVTAPSRSLPPSCAFIARASPRLRNWSMPRGRTTGTQDKAARRFQERRVVLAVGRAQAIRRTALAIADAVPRRQHHQTRNRRDPDRSRRIPRGACARLRREVPGSPWPKPHIGKDHLCHSPGRYTGDTQKPAGQATREQKTIRPKTKHARQGGSDTQECTDARRIVRGRKTSAKAHNKAQGQKAL